MVYAFTSAGYRNSLFTVLLLEIPSCAEWIVSVSLFIYYFHNKNM